jgi:hypothetical protein
MPPAVARAAAAEQQKQARLAQVNPYPTRPAQGEQANPRQDTTTTTAPSAPAERDIPWTTIAIWLAAIAAIAGIIRRTRHSGRARIAAEPPSALGLPATTPAAQRSSRPSRYRSYEPSDRIRLAPEIQSGGGRYSNPRRTLVLAGVQDGQRSHWVWLWIRIRGA